MYLELFLCFLFIFGTTSENNCDLNLDPADDPKNKHRPCPDFDVDCIREYFSMNSDCVIAEGPVPDPLQLKYYQLDIANANVTIEFNDVYVNGLNGNIVEFYVNCETEKLVLVVEVKCLGYGSPRPIYKYNRKCKEPIERSDRLDCVYEAATFTIVFSSITNLDLRSAQVFSYIEVSQPKYTLGPKVSANLDPVAQKQFQTLVDSMPIAVQEAFISQGKIFMDNYIQYNICDFGLKFE